MTGTIATEPSWATFQFEPGAKSLVVWTPPANEQWSNPLAVNVRLGFQVMFKTRAELEANWLTDEALWVDALDQLQVTQEDLENALKVVVAAQARLRAAATVSLERQGVE
jgi:hypothetical protein